MSVTKDGIVALGVRFSATANGGREAVLTMRDLNDSSPKPIYANGAEVGVFVGPDTSDAEAVALLLASFVRATPQGGG